MEAVNDQILKYNFNQDLEDFQKLDTTKDEERSGLFKEPKAILFPVIAGDGRYYKILTNVDFLLMFFIYCVIDKFLEKRI